MAEIYTPLDDINNGSTIRVRIIRMFKKSMYPSSTKSAKPGLELILMDDKNSKIEAQVRSYLCWKWANVLREFACVIISGFVLIDNKGSFKFSRNNHKINFLTTTVVTPCAYELTIPRYGFQFVNFVAILSDILDTSVLIDVSGELIEYGDMQTLSRDGVVRQMINIKLEDHSLYTFNCFWWPTIFQDVAVKTCCHTSIFSGCSCLHLLAILSTAVNTCCQHFLTCHSTLAVIQAAAVVKLQDEECVIVIE